MDQRRICLNAGVLDFMNNLMTNGATRVLEFGAGWSSLWFAARATKLLSIETSPEWHKTIKHELMQMLTPRLVYEVRPASIQEYRQAVRSEDGQFDLVLVDGDERTRLDATHMGWSALAPGGWLLFDDAQRPRHRASLLYMDQLIRRMPKVLGYSVSQDIPSARDRLTIAYQKPLS